MTETDVIAADAPMAMLLAEGHSFSLLQAVRLLTAAGLPTTITPHLSLAFPAADVATVKRPPGADHFAIVVNFLGLYGVSSPLPAFYTEELHEEAGFDGTVRRDFLDIVHRRLYELYFECCRKYRLWHGVGEGNEALLERLFSLIGLAEPELRDGLDGVNPITLIRYAPLLGRQPRSASGLQALLHDALGGLPVKVEQCVVRTVKIAAEDRLRLGASRCTLEEDAVLGEECSDVAGKFCLQIGPVEKETFESLLPGGVLRRKLSTLVQLYLSQPLDYDVELILREEDVETVRLGSRVSARLGLNTWCFSGSFKGDAHVRHE